MGASIESPYLVLPDLQMPFENPRALPFCAYLKKHYRIDDDHVLNVGDECDNLYGGSYPKDPDNNHTATSEIKATRDKIKDWSSVFPKMKLATSNHGQRWAKKAAAAEIPSQMLRAYQEILQTPPGWAWKDKWIFKEKHPFAMIHGVGFSGFNAARTAALDLGISVVMGHLTVAQIAYIQTVLGLRWGMCVASLIDREAIAFKYSKDSRFKACLGAGLIFNQGSTPVWIPLD